MLPPACQCQRKRWCPGCVSGHAARCMLLLTSFRQIQLVHRIAHPPARSLARVNPAVSFYSDICPPRRNRYLPRPAQEFACPQGVIVGGQALAWPRHALHHFMTPRCSFLTLISFIIYYSISIYCPSLPTWPRHISAPVR